MEAPPRYLAMDLTEAFRRTPSPHLDDKLPQVLPCFGLMHLQVRGSLKTGCRPGGDRCRPAGDGRWLLAEAQGIGGINCMGLARTLLDSLQPCADL